MVCCGGRDAKSKETFAWSLKKKKVGILLIGHTTHLPLLSKIVQIGHSAMRYVYMCTPYVNILRKPDLGYF